MRIAYLSTDEVNHALAQRLAAADGSHLDLLWLRDPPPDGQFDAVLCDLDSWPASLRAEVLSRLLAATPFLPVAVHSYGPEEEQTEALRSRGVTVFNQLGPEVFRTLHRAAHPAWNGHADAAADLVRQAQ
jgi:hypothetical protein